MHVDRENVVKYVSGLGIQALVTWIKAIKEVSALAQTLIRVLPPSFTRPYLRNLGCFHLPFMVLSIANSLLPTKV